MMRNFISRILAGCKKILSLKIKAIPVTLVALFLAFSIVYAMAEEFPSDAVFEIEEEGSLAAVTVIYGGAETTCETDIITVGELIDELGIILDDTHAVDKDTESYVEDGLVIRIGKYTREIYDEREILPAGEEIIYSQTIPKGERQFVSSGEDGVRAVTREITYLDGVKVSEEIVSEAIIKEAVPAVYTEGSGGTVTAADGTAYEYSYYIDVLATAYHTGGITATGHVANEEVVAVDPKVIPYGTKMFITGKWGEIGCRSAEDCGNFRGKRIDVCMEGTRAELLQFGRRNMRVYILE